MEMGEILAVLKKFGPGIIPDLTEQLNMTDISIKDKMFYYTILDKYDEYVYVDKEFGIFYISKSIYNNGISNVYFDNNGNTLELNDLELMLYQFEQCKFTDIIRLTVIRQLIVDYVKRIQEWEDIMNNTPIQLLASAFNQHSTMKSLTKFEETKRGGK